MLPEKVSLHKHEPDHIIPIQHGGETNAENLALSCFRCNRHKGPNIGSFDPGSGDLVAFYNPRKDEWQAHFRVEGGQIIPLSAKARVTVLILRLNDEKRILERQSLYEIGAYP